MHWFSAAFVFSLQATIYVKSSPLCVEADVPKKFCGNIMVEALHGYCESYPSIQSKEHVTPEQASISNRAVNDLGVTEMCCHKKCTLRILLQNFCDNIRDFRPCPRTNHIDQDQDNIQTADIERGDVKPIEKRQKQPENHAKSASLVHKTAEATSTNAKFRKARIGEEITDGSRPIIQDIPNHISKAGSNFRKYSNIE